MILRVKPKTKLVVVFFLWKESHVWKIMEIVDVRPTGKKQQRQTLKIVEDFACESKKWKSWNVSHFALYLFLFLFFFSFSVQTLKIEKEIVQKFSFCKDDDCWASVDKGQDVRNGPFEGMLVGSPTEERA